MFIGRALRSPLLWLLLVLVAAVAALVPTVAKAPVAVLGGSLIVVRFMRKYGREVKEPDTSASSLPLRFQGFIRHGGLGSWQQTLLEVDAGRARATPYWSLRRASHSIALEGSDVMVRDRVPTDRGLKPDMRVITIIGQQEGTYEIAVAAPIAPSVRDALVRAAR
jgi:hypothetical protein